MGLVEMSTAMEQHFTIPELAALWSLDPNTVRRWFENRDDVLKFGHEHRARKRRHVSIRIPASVAEKVYSEKRPVC
jgi:hypothetical protein